MSGFILFQFPGMFSIVQFLYLIDVFISIFKKVQGFVTALSYNSMTILQRILFFWPPKIMGSATFNELKLLYNFE